MVGRWLCLALILAPCPFTASSVRGATVYVDRSVPSSGNGASWATAFKTIQEGINASADRDEVIVAEGTYAESIDFMGKGITVRSTDEDDDGVVACTVIQASGSPDVVRFRSSEGRTATIAGFTITGGQIGVSCVWSSPVIRNNAIQANNADYDRGGGVSCYHSSAVIRNNTIVSNLAYAGGGGIACEGARPVITGNLILGNGADGDGGGILCEDCSPTISANRIIANVSQGNGGGISCHDSHALVTNNLIVSNGSNSTGGGISYYRSTARIVGNTIAANSAPGEGAGGIEFQESFGTVVNCVLWGNGDDISGAETTFCCIQDDTPDNRGEGNIHEYPRFFDPDGADDLLGTEDDNYRLSPDSPCVDKGSFSASATLSVKSDAGGLCFSWDPGADLLGQARIAGLAPDTGCHEYHSGVPTYCLESSFDLLAWSLLHAGADTSFASALPPAAHTTFFRVSVSR